MMSKLAPVVKWISQRSSEPLFWVRILAGAQTSVARRVPPGFEQEGVGKPAVSRGGRQGFTRRKTVGFREVRILAGAHVSRSSVSAHTASGFESRSMSLCDSEAGSRVLWILKCTH